MDFKKDKLFQQLIRKNLTELCASTDCTSQFLDILVQKILLSNLEKEVILSKPTKYERSSEFYNKITMKGPVAYKGLVNALRKTDQNFAADILCKKGGILKEDIAETEFMLEEEQQHVLTSRIARSTIEKDSKDLTFEENDDASNKFNQISLSSPLILEPLAKIQNNPAQTNINATGDSEIFVFPTIPNAVVNDPILTRFLQKIGIEKEHPMTRTS